MTKDDIYDLIDKADECGEFVFVVSQTAKGGLSFNWVNLELIETFNDKLTHAESLADAVKGIIESENE